MNLPQIIETLGFFKICRSTKNGAIQDMGLFQYVAQFVVSFVDAREARWHSGMSSPSGSQGPSSNLDKD